MSETQPIGVDIEELMRRVKAEADPRRGGVPAPAPAATPVVVAPTAVVVGAASAPLKARYALGEMLAPADEDFLDLAYRVILRRPPDPVGGGHYLQQLRAGALSKVEILGRLRYSPEGRSRGARIDGLLPAFAIQHARRLPIVGYPFALLLGIVRLPVLLRNFQALDAFVAAQRTHQQRADAQAQGAAAANVAAAVARLDAADHRFGALTAAYEAANGQIGATNVLALQAHARHDAGEQRLLVLEQRAQALEDTLRQRARDHATLQLEFEALRRNVSFRSDFDRALTEFAQRLDAATADVRQGVAELERTLAQAAAEQTAERQGIEAVRAEVAHHGATLAHHGAVIAQLRGDVDTRADAATLAAAVDAGTARVAERFTGELAQLDARLGARFEAALARKNDAEAHAQLSARVDALQGEQPAHERTRHELAEAQRQLGEHRRALADLQRRLALLLEEARRRLPAPMAGETVAALAAQRGNVLDAFYADFEDRWRGTRADIKVRARVLLAPLAQSAAAGGKAPVLDIGCGRGEWLELMRDEGYVARGIDLNGTMVAQCRELGLDVEERDALSALRALAPESLGAVTAIHVVEHLSFEDLVALFDESLRVLKPGGVVLFETPNPENLMVATSRFYIDPTHRNPLPPELLGHVAEARGFVRTAILRPADRVDPSAPRPVPADVPGAAQINTFVEMMRRPPDYILVAYKA